MEETEFTSEFSGDVSVDIAGEFKTMRIVIIGLGLIGGSIALKLRKTNPNIIGIDNQTETLQYAITHQIIDEGTSAIEEGISGADIIVLAVPVRTIFSILDEIMKIKHLPTNPNCMIIDVGSTKTQIVEKMKRLPPGLQPIGGHPMCGRETSGIESAVDTLFNDAFFMLTPLPNTQTKIVTLAQYLVRLLGARPFIVDAERHDRIAATASHLPYSVSSMLMATALEAGAEDNLLWQAISSGFRDTSRLAASDVTMMLDILMSNGKAISEEIQTYEKYLREFRTAIEKQDEQWLKEILTQVRLKRNQLFVK